MMLDKVDADCVTVTPARYGRMMVLKRDRYMGRAFLIHGEYSESEVELWRQLLPDNAIVADVGANIGSHTVALAALVPNGLVFAFEPIRFLYHMLAGNVALNGLGNVVTFHAAAGAERGQIMVPGFDFTREENYGGIALGGFEQGNPVAQVTLDAVLPRCHFLKIDVEGMELDVLKGAQRLIRECRPGLYLECNPEEGYPNDQGPTQLALIKHVQSLGYDVWWHHARHYNPDNFHGTPPQDEHESSVVSFNILCLPSEGQNEIDGLERIPPIPHEAPTPSPKNVATDD